MAVLPYSPQAHGFFTKLADGATIARGDLSLYDNPTNRARLERIRELAGKHGVSINDIVLAYLWSQPFPTIPIIGSKRIEQLHSSLKNADLALTPEEITYLEVG
jgi:aryl-alcohol dehydrogenase-like predicted oxidoreductase